MGRCANIARSGRDEIFPAFDRIVIYRVANDTLEAWRLLHGARDLPRRLIEPHGQE
jgi:hypothetical protein